MSLRHPLSSHRAVSALSAVDTAPVLSRVVAKYVSNPRFKQDLIEKTGEWPLVGGRSTADWEKWNGLIHSLIREKIKNDADLHIELARDVSNLVEMKKLQVEMLALWKEPEAESESDSDAIYHQVNLS